MKIFSYVLKDENGIHARPAGMLVKEAAKFECEITVTKGEKTVDGKRLFALMGLGAKKNDTIKFSIDGKDEEKATETIKGFLEVNF